MARDPHNRAWLLASAFLLIDLLCYFAFPVWAGLPPVHPLLPYAALALLVAHLAALYFLVRWWFGGTWQETPVPERWSWRRLRCPAGLALLVLLVAFTGPQFYLMRWPITSGDDAIVLKSTAEKVASTMLGAAPAPKSRLSAPKMSST